jgi:hypothetical protein
MRRIFNCAPACAFSLMGNETRPISATPLSRKTTNPYVEQPSDRQRRFADVVKPENTSFLDGLLQLKTTPLCGEKEARTSNYSKPPKLSYVPQYLQDSASEDEADAPAKRKSADFSNHGKKPSTSKPGNADPALPKMSEEQKSELRAEQQERALNVISKLNSAAPESRRAIAFKHDIDEINRLIGPEKLVVNRGFSRRAQMTGSISLPPYAPGEMKDVRTQDYFSMALRKAMNVGQPKNSNWTAQEIQMAFAKPNSDGKMTALVISVNPPGANALMLKELGIDSTTIVPANGVFAAEISRDDFVRVVNKARADRGGKREQGTSKEDFFRRMDKLQSRWSKHIAETITVYAPAAPKRHAEIEVADAIAKLGIKDAWPITGSKYPCIGCATELQKRGVEVPYATSLFAAQPANVPTLVSMVNAKSTQFVSSNRRRSRSP